MITKEIILATITEVDEEYGVIHAKASDRTFKAFWCGLITPVIGDTAKFKHLESPNGNIRAYKMINSSLNTHHPEFDNVLIFRKRNSENI